MTTREEMLEEITRQMQTTVRMGRQDLISNLLKLAERCRTEAKEIELHETYIPSGYGILANQAAGIDTAAGRMYATMTTLANLKMALDQK